MSDRFRAEEILATATDAAFAAGFLGDLAGRVDAVRTAGAEFADAAHAAWSGPRADNDLGLVDALCDVLGDGVAACLGDLAALLGELFEAGSEYGRALATHAYWRDCYRSRWRAHSGGDWAACGCPVDDLSGDPTAAEQYHGHALRESQRSVDDYCRRWGEVLDAAAVTVQPLVASVMRFCSVALPAGELSTSTASRGELVAAVLANRPSPHLGVELFGLTTADVAAYFAAGGPSEMLSGPELGAALAPLSDTELSAIWTTFPLAQRLELIDHRPDVASRTVAVQLPIERWRLRAAVAHPVLTNEFAQRFGLGVGVRVGVIDLGVEIESSNDVYVVKMSDGKVVVGVGLEERFGVFAETAAPGDQAHLGVGMLAFGEHVFEFESEAEAAAAIESLRRAADRSAGEFIVELFTGSELRRTIGDLGATNLISAADGRGGYVNAAGTIERLLDAGVELDVSVATYSRIEYAAPGSQQATAVHGVVASGTISATARVPARSPAPVDRAGSGVAVSGSFLLDLRTESAALAAPASFLTVTITGSAAGTVGATLAGAAPSRGGPLSVATTADRGEVASIEVTVPIDPGTNPLEVARQVATLDYFEGLSAEQLWAAEVVITHDLVVTSESRLGADVGLAELSGTITETTRSNLSTTHKPAHGLPYSQTDTNRQLEEML